MINSISGFVLFETLCRHNLLIRTVTRKPHTHAHPPTPLLTTPTNAVIVTEVSHFRLKHHTIKSRYIIFGTRNVNESDIKRTNARTHARNEKKCLSKMRHGVWILAFFYRLFPNMSQRKLESWVKYA